MKLLYATSVPYPSALANRIQTLATAAELARLLPGSFLLGVGSAKKPLPLPYRVFARSTLSPFLGLRYASFAKREGYTHFYCREDRLLAFAILFTRVIGGNIRFAYEAHTLKDTLALRFLRHARIPMVALTEGLRDDLIEYGVTAPIKVAHDGVDLGAYENVPSRAESRRELGLPEQGTVALYVGKLDGWKGVDTLLEASASFPKGVTLAVVGGPEDAARALASRYPHVRFTGPRPYEALPATLAAADIVILPNTGKEAISARHTSPLKLFAYLASGKPIVASDLPSLREVLDEDAAVLVRPDDAEALAAGVAAALADPAASARRAERGRELAKRYTWGDRARRIVALLSEAR